MESRHDGLVEMGDKASDTKAGDTFGRELDDLMGLKRRFFCTDLRSFSRTWRSLEMSSVVASEDGSEESSANEKDTGDEGVGDGEDSCNGESGSGNGRRLRGGGGLRGAIY